LEELKTALRVGDSDAAMAAVLGLEQVAQQYRTLLEQANDAILIIDPDTGRLLDWNPKAEEMIGYDSKELGNRTLADLYPEEDSAWLWSEFQKNQIEGRTATPEVPIIRADGLRIYVDSSSSLIEFGDRCVVQAILRDVTERVELTLDAERYAQELERKNKELARAQRLSSDLLAKVTHELRTPLQAVVGYTSSLLEGIYGPLNGTQRGKLQIVDANATQLSSLINQMLELSRLDAGVVSALSEDVDIVHLLEDVFAQYRDDLAAKGLEGHLRCCAQRVICRTDPVKLREIIRQLLSNAAKFTLHGGVSVTLEVNGSDAVVAVRDTGIGIPAQHLERVFDIFQTADEPFARRHSGLGLGLSLVKKLTDLLGGKVEVETAVNRGTTFTVYLPRIVRSVKGARAGEIETAKAADKPMELLEGDIEPIRHALVVDDDPYTVEFLSEFLERIAGCRVRKAYSGADAQLHLTEHRPDFLFVDLLLPQMSGERILQYCEQLWGKGRVTMIVVTAKDLTEEETAELKKRAAAVIPKGNLRTDVLTDLLAPVIPLRRAGAVIG
jgi:protein-histidine pros-kinase